MAAQERLEPAPGRDGEAVGADVGEAMLIEEQAKRGATGCEDVAGGPAMGREASPAQRRCGDDVQPLALQRQRAV